MSSHKLLHTLAEGKCVVKNATSGEVLVSLEGRTVKIGPFTQANLLQHATDQTKSAIVNELRKHAKLKELIQVGNLEVVM